MFLDGVEANLCLWPPPLQKSAAKSYTMDFLEYMVL